MKENETDRKRGESNFLGKLPADGYVRLSELIPNPIPFSPATLWRKVKDGTFPAPVKLSERVTAWRVEDVRAWMQALSHDRV
ncbi:MAG: AlpA family transcriptional regulator [Alphaproteobacteria bacterium CG_4_9_14_3_um_filter_47_13]|nr:MAG: AlpA family transcriptional regulator [Alphaproteobacteria bacterium CG_4_9_14_3_um_filter_47_13]